MACFRINLRSRTSRKTDIICRLLWHPIMLSSNEAQTSASRSSQWDHDWSLYSCIRDLEQKSTRLFGQILHQYQVYDSPSLSYLHTLCRWKQECESKDTMISLISHDANEMARELEAMRHQQLTMEAEKQIHSSILNELMSELQCPICFEILDNPQTYACGHTFCAVCVRSPACAVCRMVSSTVPVASFALRNICRLLGKH